MQKEIEEGNILIAEFLNLPKRAETAVLYEVFLLNNGRYYAANKLKYHTSHDWLMPVVYKLYDTVPEDAQQFAGLVLFELGLATPIDQVWRAVIEAIKHHNSQNNSDGIH